MSVWQRMMGAAAQELDDGLSKAFRSSVRAMVTGEGKVSKLHRVMHGVMLGTNSYSECFNTYSAGMKEAQGNATPELVEMEKQLGRLTTHTFRKDLNNS